MADSIDALESVLQKIFKIFEAENILRSKKHEDLAGEWMKYTWIIGDQSGNESRPFIPVFVFIDVWFCIPV